MFRSSSIVVVVALTALLSFESAQVQGFALRSPPSVLPFRTTTTTTTTTFLHDTPSSPTPEPANLAATKFQQVSAGRRPTKETEDTEEKTLYDILGASPTDSHQELRQRYRTLARQLHPDAVAAADIQHAAVEFSDVAAAWTTLSNPKERMRYDRSLQAKQLSNNIESLVVVCFQIAFKIMTKATDIVMTQIQMDEKEQQQQPTGGKIATAPPSQTTTTSRPPPKRRLIWAIQQAFVGFLF